LLFGSRAFAGSPAEPSVHHVEVEVATNEPGLPAATTQFAFNLEEGKPSEVSIGENVPLPGQGSGVSAIRQHVGMRLSMYYDLRGTDLLIHVDSQLSALSGTSGVHEIAAKDVALAPPGKKTVVLAISHDRSHTSISVTPTRL
jgi:hypothetical protein